MHFELCPTKTGSPTTLPRNVHNDLAFFVFVFASTRGRTRKKKESYRRSRIDETARLRISCNNCETLVLYSDWCSLSRDRYLPMLRTTHPLPFPTHDPPVCVTVTQQRRAKHCRSVCTEDSSRISLGTYYGDVCNYTMIRRSVNKTKQGRNSS